MRKSEKNEGEKLSRLEGRKADKRSQVSGFGCQEKQGSEGRMQEQRQLKSEVGMRKSEKKEDEKVGRQI